MLLEYSEMTCIRATRDEGYRIRDSLGELNQQERKNGQILHVGYMLHGWRLRRLGSTWDKAIEIEVT